MNRSPVAPFVALSIGLCGCGPSVVTGRPPSGDAWLVASPPEAPDAESIFRYDVGRNRVVEVFDLPADAALPQGLAFDGSSLWLSVLAPQPIVYELNPANGSVRSEFVLPGQGAEGIAAVRLTLWAAEDRDSGQLLRQFDLSGDEIAELLVASHMTGLGAEGSDLLLLCDNGHGANEIIRLEPEGGKRTRVSVMPYLARSRSAIGFDGERIVTVEPVLDRATRRYDKNALRWIDPVDGAIVDQRPMAVRGAISAIAWQSRPE